MNLNPGEYRSMAFETVEGIVDEIHKEILEAAQLGHLCLKECKTLSKLKDENIERTVVRSISTEGFKVEYDGPRWRIKW